MSQLNRAVLAISCLLSTTLAAEPLPFVLASVHVVSPTESEPMLRLSASGPIAFDIRPVSEDGVAAAADRLVIRLYGVAPSPGLAVGDLPPFTVSISTMPDGCELIITTRALPAGRALHARTPQQSNELEIVAVPSL